MRNEKEWASNRGYIQHLEVLKKISSRNIRVSRKASLAKLPNNEMGNDANDSKTQQKGGDNTLTKFRETSTFRERQILWENYYLGKRIIETPPVISKRKLDEDFLKHKRLVECLTASGGRKSGQGQFRVKKLQEYKENVEQHHDDRTLQATLSKNLIKVCINSLAFYRQRPTLENLDLVLTYTNKSGKMMKQNSESFPAQEILEKHFYFGISKRLMSNKQPLTMEIRNQKGLNELSIGHFTFPSSETLDKYQAQLFHCGKPVGQVEVSTSYNKKFVHLKTGEA